MCMYKGLCYCDTEVFEHWDIGELVKNNWQLFLVITVWVITLVFLFAHFSMCNMQRAVDSIAFLHTVGQF
jgi:hypothetical protein